VSIIRPCADDGSYLGDSPTLRDWADCLVSIAEDNGHYESVRDALGAVGFFTVDQQAGPRAPGHGPLSQGDHLRRKKPLFCLATSAWHEFQPGVYQQELVRQQVNPGPSAIAAGSVNNGPSGSRLYIATFVSEERIYTSVIQSWADWVTIPVDTFRRARQDTGVSWRIDPRMAWRDELVLSYTGDSRVQGSLPQRTISFGRY